MQEGDAQLKITVETLVKAELNTVWSAWNNPEDIKQWNAASDDWHTTQSTVDLREGGEYRLGDGRDVKVEFTEGADGVLVRETFEAESQIDREHQRRGWQAILDNFATHVEARDIAGTAGD
jgi:uncharacterized protein YndB with AHSA1/START domain